ncbi:MAG: protein kinase, partial [Acidobacteriota bacterium]
MTTRQDTLLRVAERVAEGSAIDWSAERRSQPDLRAKLDVLEALETLSLRTAIGAGSSSSLAGETPAPPTATVDDPGIPESWGHLQIRDRIGGGAFGEVYRAHDPQLQVDVALKLQRAELGCSGEAARRFLDEARRLARVRHPGVVVVHGADCHDGRLGLWTELLEGETLEELIERNGTLGAEEASLIGLQLCRALAAVHAAGLVHRDVKLANVMREKGGRIVLLDFSAVSEQTGGRSAGDVRLEGTPLFMAPEVLAGEEATPPADLYALGVLLYRLVSGTYPVQADDLGQLRERLRRGEATPLRDRRPDLAAGFVQVVDRALAPLPERFHTAGEMERALATALGPAKVLGEPERVGRRTWIRRLGLAAAAVIALTAGWLWIPWSSPLEVDAALFRMAGDRPVRIPAGARVSPGDRLMLELRLSRSAHVVVLDEDLAGRAFVLFPLPHLDLQNPLTAGVTLRLPGSVEGEGRYWQI